MPKVVRFNLFVIHTKVHYKSLTIALLPGQGSSNARARQVIGLMVSIISSPQCPMIRIPDAQKQRKRSSLWWDLGNREHREFWPSVRETRSRTSDRQALGLLGFLAF
jgi:hypothetical protein